MHAQSCMREWYLHKQHSVFRKTRLGCFREEGEKIVIAWGPAALLMLFSSKVSVLASALAITSLFVQGRAPISGDWASLKSNSSINVCRGSQEMEKPRQKLILTDKVFPLSACCKSAAALTWYVLSKLSYMNRVIRDVFPTAREETDRKH